MAARTIGPIIARIFGDLSNLDKSLKTGLVSLQRFGNKAKEMGESVARVGTKMTTRITLPVVAMGGMAVKTFADFEKTMRNVNTIGRQTEDQFQRTSAQVIALSTELGKRPTELAEALYFIYSSSFKGAEGMKVLEASVKAAKAGVSDVTSASTALTAVLNAYGKRADEAGDISDILFKTVEKGVLTFSDLSQYMGATISTAAISGVKFEELAAAVATMTRGGIKADEAFTAMNRFLMKLIEGGDDLNVVFKQYTGQTALAYLQTKGLGETMKALIGITEGDAEAITKLGFEMRSFKAVASLARNEGRDYAQDLNDIAVKANRAGATQDALNEQSKSLAAQWAKTRAELDALLIGLGQDLLPIVNKIVGGIRDAIKWWRGLSDETRSLYVRIAMLVAAIGPALIVIGKLIVTVGMLSKALVVLAGTMGAVNLVATAGAAIILAYGYQLGKMKEALEDESNSMSRLSATGEMANKKFGMTIGRMKAIRQQQMKKDTELQAEFNKTLASQIPLQEKIASLERVAGEVWAESVRGKMLGQIEELRKAAEAVSPTAGKKKLFTAEDLKAQDEFKQRLLDGSIEQLKVEDQINRLIEERKKLQVDLDAMRGKEGTEAYIEIQTKALEVEKNLASSIREKAKKLFEKHKELSQLAPFAGAVEAGTVEEYRVRIGMEKRDEVARNTAQMKITLGELLKTFKETNTILTENLAGYEPQLVEDIL